MEPLDLALGLRVLVALALPDAVFGGYRVGAVLTMVARLKGRAGWSRISRECRETVVQAGIRPRHQAARVSTIRDGREDAASAGCHQGKGKHSGHPLPWADGRVSKAFRGMW